MLHFSRPCSKRSYVSSELKRVNAGRSARGIKVYNPPNPIYQKTSFTNARTISFIPKLIDSTDTEPIKSRYRLNTDRSPFPLSPSLSFITCDILRREFRK